MPPFTTPEVFDFEVGDEDVDHDIDYDDSDAESSHWYEGMDGDDDEDECIRSRYLTPLLFIRAM